MPDIIGIGFRPQDKWSKNDYNVFRAKDPKEVDAFTGRPIYKTAEEWEASGNGPKYEFWGLRDAKLNAGAKAIFESNVRKGGFSIDPFLEVIKKVGYSDLKQMNSAMPSWERFADLYDKGTGHVYGIDIETFGDITHGQGVFGITEVGINKYVMDNDKLGHNAYSIAIGIDNTQRKYLESLADKFEKYGWDTLTNSEQVSLKRMSKYGGKFKDRFDHSSLIGGILDTPNGGFSIVKSLLPDNIDVDTMRKGIKNLSKLGEHSNTKPADVLSSVLKFFNDNQDELFYAANSKFDLSGISKVARLNGLDVPDEAINKIGSSILDVTYLVRAAAAADGESVSTWLHNIYGKGGNATMENLLDVFRINGVQTHMGAGDLENEMNVILKEGLFIYDTYKGEFNHHPEHFDKDKTIFYIQKGQFDKTHGDDFAYVPDSNAPGGYRATQSYSITEEFWRINTERSGNIEVDGETKYRLVMDNQADMLNGNPHTSIVLTGDTVDDVVMRLQHMAEPVHFDSTSKDPKALTDFHIKTQQEMHYIDLGRREFDKMFNPTDVRVNDSYGQLTDEYGYVSLKKKLEIEDMISAYEEKNNVSFSEKTGHNARQLYEISYNNATEKAIEQTDEEIKRLISTGKLDANNQAKINEIKTALTKKYRKANMAFATDYEAQSFLGMRKVLQERRSLFDDIIEQIDRKMPSATNMDKTIVAQNAYKDITRYISENYKLDPNTWKKDPRTERILFSDIKDIDILLRTDKNGENIYSRVDGYNKKTIADGLSNVYKRMSSDEVVSSITDLKDRNIISFYDEKEFTNLINSVRNADVSTKNSYNSSMYFIAQDVSEHIENLYENGQIGYRNLRNTNRDIGRELLEFENPIYKKEKDNKKLKLKNIIESNRDEINKRITASVQEQPTTVYLDNIGEEQIDDLLERLNMKVGSSEYDIKQKKSAFNTLFNGKKKPYSLGKEKNLQSFLVNNEGGSSFLFVTKDKDSQRLYKALNDGIYDFSSYSALRDSVEDTTGYLGAMFELPKVNKYKIGENKYITTVNQGPESEKFLFPVLNGGIQDKDGKYHLYLNDADFDMATLPRRYMEKAINKIQADDYSGASLLGRKTFNKTIEDLPSSASYRRINGERQIFFGPSDFIHADEMHLLDGLKNMFAHIANQEIEDPNNLNVAQQIVRDFGIYEEINTWMLKKDDKTLNDYIKSVMSSDVFDQFISSRMVVGKVTDTDAFKKSSLKILDDPILEIIRKDVMEHWEDYGFAKSSLKVLNSLPKASELDPVGTETATKKGAFFTTRPGEYNAFSNASSIMRPLYTQQSNGLSFDLKTAVNEKSRLFRGFDNNAVSYGTTYLENKDSIARKYLRDGNINVGERNFLLKVKYMSDYELQQKLHSLTDVNKNKRFRNKIMKEFNISEEQFFEVAKVFQKDMFSLHEDNAIISSALKETDLFQSRESMKYKVNLDNLDEEKTLKALRKVLGKKEEGILNNNTVMYIKKNGQPVFYNGPEAVFSLMNYNTIKDGFKDGADSVSTFLDLTQGTIFDDKMIFNGNEKATTHSINLDLIRKITNKDRDFNIYLSNSFFSFISDGAPTILNPKSAKHGMVHTALNNWSTIVDFYSKAGKEQQNNFVNYLNNFVKDNKKLSAGIGQFRIENDRIVGDMAYADHPVAFVEHILEDIYEDNGFGLNTDINKSIKAFIEDNKEKNISYAVVQRQHMTEFLGKKYTMDQRSEQAMLMRGMNYSFNGGNGITENSEALVKDLRNYAFNYDATGTYFSKDGFSNIQSLIDKFNVAHNEDKLHYASAHKDMQRSIKGIIETVEAYNSKPKSLNDIRGNIIEFNINDLIESSFWSEGGVSTDDLRSSFFYVDGRPSKLLQQKAVEQGVDLSKSNSVFVNMNRKIKTKGGTMDGVLIPIQNVNALADDKHFFQNAQGKTTNFMNRAIDVIKNNLSEKDKGKTIDDFYAIYVSEITKELNYLEKSSDFTKAMNQYAIPTSTYLLGQDEASPLFKSQLSQEWKNAYKEKIEAEKALLKDDQSIYDINLIKKYEDASNAFQGKLDELSKDIRFHKKRFSDFAALASEGNKHMAEAIQVIDKNGKKHHGMAIAMGREGLEAAGFDFAGSSLAIFNEMEKIELDANYKGRFDGMNKFAKEHIEDYVNIKSKLLQLKDAEGNLIFDESKPMIEQLNAAINTKTLNEAIANSGGFTERRIVDLFKTSKLAESYLSEYGMLADAFRSPVFRSQPVIKVMFDESIKGRQGRFLDPVMSMLSNIDFDGDTFASIFRFNGGIMLTNDSKTWKRLNKEWTRFSLEDYDNLLADLMKEGSAFRREIAYSPNLQQASVLKIIDKEVYEEAQQAFLNNHKFEMNGVRIRTLEQLSEHKGLEFAADNSHEMATMFESKIGNTLKNENMTLAALAARTRKDYIGKVSTPAFRIRASLIDTMESKNISKDQRLMLNDILVGFDNMLSERGGFMAISEQKGIDTKFAEDAIKYSRLAQWATSINSIVKFDSEKNEAWKLEKSIKGIMEAIGPNLYKLNSKSDIKNYTDLVLHTSEKAWRNGYESMMNDLRTTGSISEIPFAISKGKTIFLKDIDTLQELWSLSSFTRAVQEIPELPKIFRQRYDGAKTVDFFLDVHNRDDIDDLRTQLRNTPARAVIDVASDVDSGRKTKSPYKKNMMYFETGTIFDDFSATKYYVSSGGNTFEEYYANQPMYRSGPIFGPKQHFSNDHFKNQKGFDFSNFRRELNSAGNQISKTEVDNAIMTERLYNTINRLTIGKKGLRTDADKQLTAMYHKRGTKKIFSEYEKQLPWFPEHMPTILEWLQGSFNGQNMSDAEDYISAYDMAKSRGYFKDDGFSSGMDLIRSINHDIAEKGWRDISGLGKPADDMYSVLLRPHVMRAFNGEKNFERFLDLSINMPNFDEEKYAEAIDSLNDSLYDINSLKAKLGTEYDKLAQEKDHWLNNSTIKDPDTSALDNVMGSSRKEFISSRMNKLLEKNANIIADAHIDVYDMFEDKEQIKNFFGWDFDKKGSQKVGFGEFMGQDFKDLSSSDISMIMNSSIDDYANGLDDDTLAKLEYAMEETKNALDGYESTSSTSAITRKKSKKPEKIIKNTRNEVNTALTENRELMEGIENQIEEEVEETVSEEAEKAAKENTDEAVENTMKKNTLRGELFSSMKETLDGFGISKKTVAVAAGALAALGVINNIIHHDAPHSPLEPSRISNNNNDPYLKNGETQYKAPPSPKGSKTVYHHRGSGLNFKVNARTKSMIDAQNNARLIGMAGGGQPSIHSYADMSGVTNNWLENKFAELVN